MKEIKDYLHLYPGCEVQYKYNFTTKIGSELRVAKLNYVGTNGITYFVDLTPIDKYGKLSSTGTFRLNVNDITPIFRPLSDMTEEEAIELIRVEHDEKNYPILSDIDIRGKGCVYFNARDEKMKHTVLFCVGFSNNFSPKETLWLLSKHFDLFGLIEAGLAVDKTTLK